MKKQTIRMRTLTLITSGFIAHVVFGILNSILVIRALGESGIGIYVLIRPTLAFLTTLTGLGTHKIRPALTVAILLLLGAGPLSRYVLHEPGTLLPLLFMAPLVVVTSMTQKFDAYLTYLDNSSPAAFTSILYQMVKIGSSLFFIHRFGPYGAPWVISGLILSFLLAESVFLGCTALVYISQKKREAMPQMIRYLKRPNTIKNTDSPIQAIVATTEFLEPIIVMQLFFGLGLPSEISRSLYGAVSGFTMPILLMPLFFTQSLVKVAKNTIKEQGPSQVGLLLPQFTKGIFMVCGLYILLVILFPAEVINLYFQTSTGSQYLPPLGLFMLLYYFKEIFLAFLSAMGESKDAVVPVLISSLIRLLLMFALLPNLRFNIFGLVYATNAYLLLSTLWIFLKLKKKARLKILPTAIFNPILVFSITWLFGGLLRNHLHSPISEASATWTQVLMIGAFYLVLTRLTGLWPASSDRGASRSYSKYPS